jgi:hypothetical protein
MGGGARKGDGGGDLEENMQAPGRGRDTPVGWVVKVRLV